MTVSAKPPVSYNTYSQLAHLESYYKNGSSTITILVGTRLAVIDIAARAFADFARFFADAVHCTFQLSLKGPNRASTSLGEALGHLAFAVFSMTIGLLLPSQVVMIMDDTKLAGRGAMHGFKRRCLTTAKITATLAAIGGFVYGVFLLNAAGMERFEKTLQKCRDAEKDALSGTATPALPTLTPYEWFTCKSLFSRPPYHHYIPTVPLVPPVGVNS